jgi:amidohydrolase
MTNPVLDRLEADAADLTAIRRDIHAHPEPGLQEVRTAALVAEKLKEWGITHQTGIGRTGVVATIQGKRPGQRAIGLRADMDCLFITERTGLPHASTNLGKMHACGHDGHTTMLLGAARELARNPDFAGTVHLIFQPAEEGMGGAKAMLADGLFDRFPCDAIYGLHNMPGLAPGHFAIRKGPFLAAGDRFKVGFLGTGGHGGASPHLASDVTVAQANFVMALQTIVARSISPVETAVVSVGSVIGGDPHSPNVMPALVTLTGTCRTFREEVRDIVERRMNELATSIAAAYGCTAEVEYVRGGIPLVNHGEQTEVAARAATVLAGTGAVESEAPPITGGEDFAAMLKVVPGAFMFIGNGIGEGPHAAGLHTPDYDFNDAILPVGAAYWVGIVAEELGLQRG